MGSHLEVGTQNLEFFREFARAFGQKLPLQISTSLKFSSATRFYLLSNSFFLGQTFQGIFLHYRSDVVMASSSRPPATSPTSPAISREDTLRQASQDARDVEATRSFRRNLNGRGADLRQQLREINELEWDDNIRDLMRETNDNPINCMKPVQRCATPTDQL